MATRSFGMRLTLALLGCALLASVAQAKTVTFTVEAETMTVAGCTAYTDGELLVPATACRDLLEATLAWDGDIEAVVFAAPPTTLTFFNDKNRVLINGEETFLTHKPRLVGGKMLLPIGYLCETLGAKLTRTAPGAAEIKLAQWPSLTSPSERKPLEIEVGGVPYTPEAYRALPTSDQLRVGAAEVAEMFGGEVQWDRELRAATLVIDEHHLVFFENKATGVLDGEPVKLSRKPVMSKVQLLIPFDSVCDLLGRSVDQVGAAKFVVGEPTK